MMNKALITREFPEFPAMPEVAALLSIGMEDQSWHNDACPKFASADGRLMVFVEHPDPEQRESEDGRFCVMAGEFNDSTEGDILYCGDDWPAALAALTGAMRPTIGGRVTEQWRGALAPEVLALPIASGCGADCFAIINSANALLASLGDIDQHQRSGIIRAVAAQCGVFYFG